MILKKNGMQKLESMAQLFLKTLKDLYIVLQLICLIYPPAMDGLFGTNMKKKNLLV